MNAKHNVSNHVQKIYVDDPMNFGEHNDTSLGQEIHYLCEAAFLSGYGGSGKSSVLQSLIRSCNQEGWFVVSCKFEKHTEPVKGVLRGFDDFFRTWASDNNVPQSNRDPSMVESFRQVCRAVSSTIDEEGLRQMCEAIPSLAHVFPKIAATKSHSRDQGTNEKVGSAIKRFRHLFHVIFKSICSAGRPVLITHDDMHLAGSMAGQLFFSFFIP